MPDGRKPEPGGWNRIHFVVGDIDAEVERLAPLASASATTSSAGPAVGQILLDDLSGNPVEIFQPAD